jgi:hypothetical protein
MKTILISIGITVAIAVGFGAVHFFNV